MVCLEGADGPQVAGALHQGVHRLFAILDGAGEEPDKSALCGKVREVIQKLHHVQAHGLFGGEAEVGAEGGRERAEVGYAVVQSYRDAFAVAWLRPGFTPF